MNNDGFIMPKKRLVWALLAVFAVLILGFAMLLRTDLRRAKSVDPADYTETLTGSFKYLCEVSHTGGAAVFSGWALVEGEKFESVDTRVVLYNAEDGVYLEVPTTMSDRPDARETINDDINYAFGGFYAFLTDKQLKYPLESYEICIAFRSNRHNALVRTGQFAEVTA
jgi:hypothetical protein